MEDQFKMNIAAPETMENLLQKPVVVEMEVCKISIDLISEESKEPAKPLNDASRQIEESPKSIQEISKHIDTHVNRFTLSPEQKDVIHMVSSELGKKDVIIFGKNNLKCLIWIN